ncbi:kiwellin-1-like [Cicer arietinum]|uniref:Ripening-related protein 1 n=1 Tax=Cicer arietinum TaxID=3827 RepID=A0A1S2YW26_CICAR|nr:putative ripening-related protein 1 [Cicer arietinum]
MKGIKICSNYIQTILFLLILISNFSLSIEASTCKPSGKIKNLKTGQCNRAEESECCKPGKLYTTFKCSPKVSHHTKAILTLNSFEKGGSGGSASKCDNKFHSDKTPVVALSTGWFNNSKRCLKFVNIFGNGKMVKAKVVDECDSTKGCDSDHDFQPPCLNNIVDASAAVWKGLGVPEKDWGQMNVFWSDA